MHWLTKIQSLPQEKKIRIMWTVAGTVAIILVLLWILSAKWQKNVSGDQTLFQTLGQGFHNIKENYGK